LQGKEKHFQGLDIVFSATWAITLSVYKNTCLIIAGAVDDNTGFKPFRTLGKGFFHGAVWPPVSGVHLTILGHVGTVSPACSYFGHKISLLLQFSF
jgi:hypothetical protein